MIAEGTSCIFQYFFKCKWDLIINDYLSSCYIHQEKSGDSYGGERVYIFALVNMYGDFYQMPKLHQVVNRFGGNLACGLGMIQLITMFIKVCEDSQSSRS